MSMVIFNSYVSHYQRVPHSRWTTPCWEHQTLLQLLVCQKTDGRGCLVHVGVSMLDHQEALLVQKVHLATESMEGSYPGRLALLRSFS